MGNIGIHGEANETMARAKEERGLKKSYLLYNPCGMSTFGTASFIDNSELLGKQCGIGNGVVRYSKDIGFIGPGGEHVDDE